MRKKKKANAHKSSLSIHTLPPLPENTLEKMEWNTLEENVDGLLYTLNYISLLVGENLNIIKIIF